MLRKYQGENLRPDSPCPSGLSAWPCHGWDSSRWLPAEIVLDELDPWVFFQNYKQVISIEKSFARKLFYMWFFARWPFNTRLEIKGPHFKDYSVKSINDTLWKLYLFFRDIVSSCGERIKTHTSRRRKYFFVLAILFIFSSLKKKVASTYIHILALRSGNSLAQ